MNYIVKLKTQLELTAFFIVFVFKIDKKGENESQINMSKKLSKKRSPNKSSKRIRLLISNHTKNFIKLKKP